MRRPLVTILSIAFLIGQVGCASKRSTFGLHPSEEARKQLGAIGLVGARFPPETNFRTPAKGSIAGAARGAAEGFAVGAGSTAVSGVYAGAAAPPPLGLIILGALIALGGAIGMVVGGVEGALTAPPTATVQEAEAVLREALTALKVQEELQMHVLRAMQDDTSHPVVFLPTHGPAVSEEELGYQALAAEGLETILEVSVSKLGLAGGFGGNPSLGVFMTARARLVRTRDAITLHDATVEYRSRRRKFTEWAENDAQLFLAELKRSYRTLAEKIVEDIFLLYVPPATVIWF